MPSPLLRPVALCCLLGLQACATVVPSTLAQLGQMSPLTMEAEAVTVAVVLPPGLSIPPGSAILSLGAERSDTGESRSEDFVLAQSQGDSTGLPAGAGGQVALFQIAKADLPRMAAQQSAIAAMKAEAPDQVKGSLSLGLGGCAVAGGPSDDARVAAFIRTAKGAAFLPLIRETPVKSLLGAELFAAIGPCGG